MSATRMYYICCYCGKKQQNWKFANIEWVVTTCLGCGKEIAIDTHQKVNKEGFYESYIPIQDNQQQAAPMPAKEEMPQCETPDVDMKGRDHIASKIASFLKLKR